MMWKEAHDGARIVLDIMYLISTTMTTWEGRMADGADRG